MKLIKKGINPMNITEKLLFYLNRFEQKRRKDVKDFADRKSNLYNHVKKDMMSDNLYILICTVIYSLILFSFCVVSFLLAGELLMKLLIK